VSLPAIPPPWDRRMWRLLLARVHPDAGGQHELFIWARQLKDHVCENSVNSATGRSVDHDLHRHESVARVDFSSAFDLAAGFAALTRRAVEMARDLDPPHSTLLLALADCYEARDGALYRQQHQGATYRQLAYVAHLAGLSREERSRWYEICRSIPLSQRHAGHLITRLKESRAA
jgi:hypothetical protein